MSSTHRHGPDPVALYLRVSSEEQRDRETIEIQEEFLGGSTNSSVSKWLRYTRMTASRVRSPCMNVPRAGDSSRTPKRASSGR